MKCEHCPANGQDRPCLTEITRHTRYCQLVDPSSAIYNPLFIPVLRADPDCLESSQEAQRTSVAESISLIARMKKCDHWEASSSCGCGNNRCRLGKGQNGIVSHANCFDCLRSTSPP